jgi:hypothetical protein
VRHGGIVFASGSSSSERRGSTCKPCTQGRRLNLQSRRLNLTTRTEGGFVCLLGQSCRSSREQILHHCLMPISRVCIVYLGEHWLGELHSICRKPAQRI